MIFINKLAKKQIKSTNGKESKIKYLGLRFRNIILLSKKIILQTL